MKGYNILQCLHAKQIEHAKIGNLLLLTSYLEITEELAAISLGRVSKAKVPYISPKFQSQYHEYVFQRLIG